MITTTPLIPVMIAMNTYNQMKRSEAKQREKTEHEQEIVHHKHNYNGTSCAHLTENGIACCYVIPANTVMTCNIF